MLPPPIAWLAIGAVFLLPYAGDGFWWRYLAADAAILATAALALGRRAPERLGLRIPLRHLGAGAALLVFAAATALVFVRRVLPDAGLDVELQLRPHWVALSVSQAFHQEIVLRGGLLGAVRRRVGSDLAASVPVAVAFVAAHAVFFGWKDGTVLPLAALATLFAFAWVGNQLFLSFGHVAFPLALHAGWNAVRFNAEYDVLWPRRRLAEGETFAVVEGHPLALLGALVLVVGIAIWLRPWGRTRRPREADLDFEERRPG